MFNIRVEQKKAQIMQITFKIAIEFYLLKHKKKKQKKI